MPAWKRCLFCDLQTFAVGYAIWLLFAGVLLNGFKASEVEHKGFKVWYIILALGNIIGSIILLVGSLKKRATLIATFIWIDAVLIITLYAVCIIEAGMTKNEDFVCAIHPVLCLLCLFGIYSYYVELIMNEL